VSDQLEDGEYTRGQDIFGLVPGDRLHVRPELHLAVSVRSFRSEKVSELVKNILDGNGSLAARNCSAVEVTYPIALTRDLGAAKDWLRQRARGSERIGILASSGAYRLRPFGIQVRTRIDPKHWFLNGKEDIRSSHFLEDVATEFDIQGLELDWACVAWDADLAYVDGGWEYRRFRGTRWQRISDETRRLYLKNAYRVLLTRARQGMVIFVPEGDCSDVTRDPEHYDGTFAYLRSIGIAEI